MRIVALALIAGAVVSAQGRGGGQQVPIDEARARQLYVSNRHEDHPVANYQAAIDAKAKEDARYIDACRGVMECTKITYRSSVGDMDIPAYLFQPLDKGGPRSRAAMIWVHGGVHGNWAISYFPFVREAVQKGYVITWYQPKVDALTQQAVGMDALVRWEHPERGMIPPIASASWAGATAVLLRCTRCSARNTRSRPPSPWCP